MLYLGDYFESPSGPHMRFRGELKDCRDCPLNKQCMKNDVKAQGRQISVLVESQRKVTHLDKMRKNIDSEDGKRMYNKQCTPLSRYSEIFAVINDLTGSACAVSKRSLPNGSYTAWCTM
jgi:hypothetical protein